MRTSYLIIPTVSAQDLRKHPFPVSYQQRTENAMTCQQIALTFQQIVSDSDKKLQK